MRAKKYVARTARTSPKLPSATQTFSSPVICAVGSDCRGRRKFGPAASEHAKFEIQIQESSMASPLPLSPQTPMNPIIEQKITKKTEQIHQKGNTTLFVVFDFFRI